MSTRIRYTKLVDGSLEVKEPILCNARMIIPAINPATLTYTLFEGDSITVEGQGTSLSDVKKRVKADLITLGANFTKEIRNRGKTEIL